MQATQKTNRELAQKKLDEAKRELWGMERMKDEEITQKITPIQIEARKQEREITISVSDRYFPKIEELQKAVSLAQQEFNELAIEESKTKWYPVGTKVIKWEQSNYSKKWSKTKETGIVAIFDENSECPDNLGSYSIPRIGDLVVYLHKKDGATGKKFVLISDKYSNNDLGYAAKKWYAENEDPNNPKPTINELQEL